MGYDEDTAAWSYFYRHWKAWFPSQPSRSSYVRHCANLWWVKQQLQQTFCEAVGGYETPVHRVDGFPMPLCNFRRARRCRLFEGEASYGYCAAKHLTYYGFQGVGGCGVITGMIVMAAHQDEAQGVYECLTRQRGMLEGDKGFIRPRWREDLERWGLHLQPPWRRNMKETCPVEAVKALNRDRRLVETVISQLTERFHIQRIRARDLWHLTVRVTRKILSHTIAVLINCLTGRPPLQLADLAR